MGILDSRNTTNAAANVLGNVRETLAAAANPTPRNSTTNAGNGQTRADRPPSLFWLNVGVVLPGAGKDGDDLFVSLPMGIPLDDMKPQEVRGNSPDWINLVQAKNLLLEQIQQAAAGLAPGDRVQVPQLTVELTRKGEPAQRGDATTNPLFGLLQQRLSGN